MAKKVSAPQNEAHVQVHVAMGPAAWDGNYVDLMLDR